MKIIPNLLCIALLMNSTSKAQTDLIRPEVSQQIGLTTMRISYHSPLSKKRKVWGNLVPYNEVWRAGANENTTISFSTDVLVEGQPLKAGNYGLHMIPTLNEWTIIFSKNDFSWGSYFYVKSDDALRVTVVTSKRSERHEYQQTDDLKRE